MQQRIGQDLKRVKSVMADFKALTVRGDWGQHSCMCARELGTAYV